MVYVPAALIIGRQRWQSALDFDRARLKLLFQTRRQRSIPAKLLFKAGREITVPLGQSWWQATFGVVSSNVVAVLGAEAVPRVALIVTRVAEWLLRAQPRCRIVTHIGPFARATGRGAVIGEVT